MPSFWQKLWMRRTFIVDRKFQSEVVLRSLFSSLFLMFVVVVGLFLPLMQEIDGSGEAHPLDAAAVASAFLYLHDHLLPILGIYLFFAVLSAIRFSHRIAGPMVRFKRDLYSIGEGRFPAPLRTRDDDYMQAEVRALNAMSRSLERQTRDICAAEEELTQALQDWRAEQGDVVQSRETEAVRAVERCAEQLRARLDFFRDASADRDIQSAETEEQSEEAPALQVGK